MATKKAATKKAAPAKAAAKKPAARKRSAPKPVEEVVETATPEPVSMIATPVVFADPRVGTTDVGPGPQPYPPRQEPRVGQATGGQRRAQEPIPVPVD